MFTQCYLDVAAAISASSLVETFRHLNILANGSVINNFKIKQLSGLIFGAVTLTLKKT